MMSLGGFIVAPSRWEGSRFKRPRISVRDAGEKNSEGANTTSAKRTFLYVSLIFAPRNGGFPANISSENNMEINGL